MISVVIPTHQPSGLLHAIRSALSRSSLMVECIIVAGENLRKELTSDFPKEKIIFSKKQGRGYKMSLGAETARGQIILFLHDDTLLPPAWDHLILNAMKDENASGGAFSLEFNRSECKYRALSQASRLYYRLTGEFWGDRGIFIKTEILKNHPGVLKVPIMEDIHLSQLIRKQGKAKILKQAVKTDVRTFEKKGFFRHLLIIGICRFLFAIKITPEKIYQIYYP